MNAIPESTPSTSRPTIIHAPGSPMEQVLEFARRISLSDCAVIISGETGSGKELIARIIHDGSENSKGRFVPVNCGAIPETLIETELFGHVKGAFTGATRDHTGRFSLASNGTIFLDEIGEMPLNMQVKLLRVLQEKAFEPVGCSKSIRANFRVIAATNRCLWEMTQDGKFRQDLYYRLNVIPIHIPPLRERPMDIMPLALNFLEEYNKQYNTAIKGFTQAAMDLMIAYRWPGNIRELQNVVARVVVLNRSGMVDVAQLPGILKQAEPDKQSDSPSLMLNEDGLDLRATMEQIERDLLTQALHRTSGNKKQAAVLLSINRTTLVEKLRRHACAA